MADRDAPEAGLLIDGARIRAASGGAPVRNSATGSVVAHVSQAGSWRRATVAERACCYGWHN